MSPRGLARLSSLPSTEAGRVAEGGVGIDVPINMSVNKVRSLKSSETNNCSVIMSLLTFN